MKLDKLFTLPVALSLILHAALIIFVAGNWVQSKPKETVHKPHFVNATLIGETPKAVAAPQQPKPQVLEAKRKQEQQRQQQEAQERQKAETNRIARQKEREAKTKAEEARLKKNRS